MYQTITTELYLGAMGTRPVAIEYNIDKHGEAELIGIWMDIDDKHVDLIDMMKANVTDKLHDLIEQNIAEWRQASAEFNADLAKEELLLNQTDRILK